MQVELDENAKTFRTSGEAARALEQVRHLLPARCSSILDGTTG